MLAFLPVLVVSCFMSALILRSDGVEFASFFIVIPLDPVIWTVFSHGQVLMVVFLDNITLPSQPLHGNAELEQPAQKDVQAVIKSAATQPSQRPAIHEKV